MRYFRYNPITNLFDRDITARRSVLPQLMWHITDRCPLSCPYCFATKTGQDTSLAGLGDVLEMCRVLGVQKIDLAGGEPLVFWGLPEIAVALQQAGIAITLTTSGLGSESNIRWLQHNASLFARIIVSVDGATASTHDLLRGMPGSFERLAGLIASLQLRGYDRIRINTVVVAPTLPRCPELVHTISKLRPAEWCLIQPHPANKKASFESYSLSAESFEKCVSEIATCLGKEGSPIRLLNRSLPVYSGYWVLYPDGILRRHSNTEADMESLPFRRDQLALIKALVSNLGVTVPMSHSDRGSSKEEPMTSVENVQHSRFGSDLLKFVAEVAEAEGVNVEVVKESRSGEKDSIIATVLIGIATNALYDLLKTAASRFADRSDYSGLTVLNIEGTPTKLDDILR